MNCDQCGKNIPQTIVIKFPSGETTLIDVCSKKCYTKLIRSVGDVKKGAIADSPRTKDEN